MTWDGQTRGEGHDMREVDRFHNDVCIPDGGLCKCPEPAPAAVRAEGLRERPKQPPTDAVCASCGAPATTWTNPGRGFVPVCLRHYNLWESPGYHKMRRERDEARERVAFLESELAICERVSQHNAAAHMTALRERDEAREQVRREGIRTGIQYAIDVIANARAATDVLGLLRQRRAALAGEQAGDGRRQG